MRRPSLGARLFIREPRGPVSEWDVASAARWAARAGVSRATQRRVLAGKTGAQLLALTYAAVAAAAATPAEADAVWVALGDLKARAAQPVGSPRRSPSPARTYGRAVPTAAVGPPPPHRQPAPPEHTALTAEDLCGVEPAALASALAAWAGFGAPRTLAEAAAGRGRRLLGRGLDGRAWAKLCRDCGLLVPPALDATGADIIFARVSTEAPAARPARRAWACGGAPATVRAPPPRRLDFKAAVTALCAIAAKSGRPLGFVLRSVVAGEPAVEGTLPDAHVRWHDDKETFTATAARGGPSVLGGCGTVDAAALVNRSLPADVRGTPVPTAQALRKAVAAAGLGGRSASPHWPASPVRHASPARHASTTPTAAGGLPRVIATGTPFSATSSRSGWAGEEDEAGGQTPPARHRPPPSPTPPPPPPHLRGRGTPSSPLPLTSDPTEEAALRSVFSAFALFGASRSGPPSPVKGGSGGGPHRPCAPSFNVRASWDCGLGGGGGGSPATLTPTAFEPTAAAPPHPLPALDGVRWAKLVREAGLLGGGLDAAAADLIFARARAAGATGPGTAGGRRLSYGRFKAALRLVAAAKHVPPASVVRAVVGTGGPALQGPTLPAPVKWHDDLSTYTGTAARGGPDVGSLTVDLATLTDRARPWKGGEV